MSVVKSLVGGVIGAGIATGIYYAIKISTGETYVWFPLITGILSGVGARALRGPSTSNAAAYMSGALAGLIAGVAIFGVEIGPALMVKDADTGPLAIRSSSTPEQDAENTEPEAADKEPGAGDAELKAADGGENQEPAKEAAESSETGDVESADKSTDTEDRFDPKADSQNRAAAGKEAADAESAEVASDAATAAEMEQKKAWYDEYLIYFFGGIGILLAYQITRGFGNATPKSAKA